MERKARGTYYGGHQGAAVVGEHPYMTLGDIFATMVHGNREDLSDNPVIRRGLICEPGLIDWLEKDRRANLKRDVHVIDEQEIFAGTLDAVELKSGIVHDVTVTTTRSKAWHGGVAKYKQLQLQWYMGIVENCKHVITRNGMHFEEWPWPVADHSILTVFYADTGDIEQIPVWKDEGIISRMRSECLKFHREHVEKKIPPCDVGDSAIKIIYPKDDGDTLENPDKSFIDAALQFSQAREMAKEWTESKKRCATILRNQLKTKSRATWNGENAGSVTWKTSKGKTVVDHEAMGKDLCEKLDLGYAELCERYEVEKPGPRVLRVTMKKNKTEEKK